MLLKQGDLYYWKAVPDNNPDTEMSENVCVSVLPPAKLQCTPLVRTHLTYMTTGNVLKMCHLISVRIQMMLESVAPFMNQEIIIEIQQCSYSYLGDDLC